MKKLLNHKRNKRIVFDEDSHTYTYFDDLRKKESERFQGITSWIGSFSSSKFDPIKQAKSSNNNPNSPYYNWGEQTILDHWDETRDEGSRIHKAIENSVNLGEVDPQYDMYITKFWEIMDELEIKPFVSEFVVYDEDIKRATPIDVCGVRNGLVIPIDVKTFKDGMQYLPYGGKHLIYPLDNLYESKYEKVSLQVSIAKKWLEEKYNVQCGQGYVVVLNEDTQEAIPTIDYSQTYVNKMYDYEKSLRK
jgi:hypothetical protein